MFSKVSVNQNDVSNPDKRGQIVLSAIVSEHLLTGQPVGSKVLAHNFANTKGWSSATIRTVMGELEDAGYVEQPHTSAGRVPTDKGYRYYVDNLLGVLTISDRDLRLINESFGLEGFDNSSVVENLMEGTSRLLSVVSENVGIVISPGISQANLQHINFVNLSDNRILIVMVYAPNIVQNKIIRIKDSFTQEELDRTARYLNSEFTGKSLTAIRAEILRLMHEEKALFDKMLQTAMIICSQGIEESEDRKSDVYIDGASRILTKPDFADFQKLHELLRIIEEKSNLVQILNGCIDLDDAQKGDVQVIIGSENSATSLHHCTLITAPYKTGNDNAFGTLSVLGPTRIEYARLIALVSYIAKNLEKTILSKE